MSDTWANIAAQRKQEPKKPHSPSPLGLEPGSKVAVLDASAIIGGHAIGKYGEKLYTTAEVCNEVQDKQSKQLLATNSAGLTAQEPVPASVTAVTSFARAIGEIHSLSRADLHLIALAHNLHISLHGEGSLHSVPAQARSVSKGKQASRMMPGWGAMGGRWEAMDKMEEAEKAALEGRQGQSEASRVAAQIQELSLRGEPEQPSTPIQAEEAAAPTVLSIKGAEQANGVEAGSLKSNGLDDDDQWEVAAVSQNAARRRRRKEARRAYTASVVSELPSSLHHSKGSYSTSHPAQTGAVKMDDSESEGEHSSLSDVSGQDSSSSEDLSNPEESHEGWEESKNDREEPRVSIVTADFAMQNLILQLGLQLVSPDGRQIKRISLYALRCSACFKVTKEVERMFCPTCGNAALQKVEVVINEHGAEQFGVRKRHIIRGTKFSLPKPKGGKKSSDPILREDVMMQRMPRRREKAPTADPFAPEYNATTWHKAKGAYAVPQMPKGVAAALASWKHNPNERRMTRTNRRK